MPPRPTSHQPFRAVHLDISKPNAAPVDGNHVRAQMRSVFGVDMPLGGGSGLTRATAVVLEGSCHVAATEYAYLKFLSLFYDLRWQVVGQRRRSSRGRVYDELSVRFEAPPAGELPADLERDDLGATVVLHFDVTEAIEPVRHPAVP